MSAQRFRSTIMSAATACCSNAIRPACVVGRTLSRAIAVSTLPFRDCMTTRSVSIQRGSSDTDESSPNRCKNGTDQQVEWIVAKRGAVSAHLGAQAADLIMAGCIEQAGQDNHNRSDEVHRLLPLGPSIGSSLSALLAGATNPARETPSQIQLGLVNLEHQGPRQAHDRWNQQQRWAVAKRSAERAELMTRGTAASARNCNETN